MYFTISLIGLGLLIAATLYKMLFKSPNIFYKVQSISAFTSLSVLFLVIYIYFLKEPSYIDLALIYVIINYIGIIAIIKYVTFKFHLQNKDTTP